jgi:septal ring factor EnvC (AmiA/AmiB activator)
MNNSKNKLFISLLTILMPIILVGLMENVRGQDRKSLEERKEQTQKDIVYTNKLLQETESTRKNTLQRVRILDKRIQLRNELIGNINSEISLIENEIDQKTGLIKQMQTDLEGIKSQYAQLIVRAYWNRDKRDWLLFIMSSDNFNQAYRRMKYLQQFSRHRREQAELIMKMQEEIKQEIRKLENTKEKKEALALEKTNENHSLEVEKRSKNRLVSDLAKRGEELRKEIKEKQAIAKRLEKEIADILAAEARKRKSGNIQLTPEERLISDNFQGNKGKLPWPVERGVITQKYGVHPHQVLKQVNIDNDGIDISTVKGAEVRALFEGEVTKIVAILGANYTVILRHGNFLTVYQNLVNLQVKQGDKIKTKQVLGTVYTDNETNSTVLHMEVWKESNIQDPEDWISRR